MGFYFEFLTLRRKKIPSSVDKKNSAQIEDQLVSFFNYVIKIMRAGITIFIHLNM